MEPNATFNEPFHYNMSGMLMRPGKGNLRIVTRLFPSSPASEAGLQIDDHILAINTRPAKEYNFLELIA